MLSTSNPPHPAQQFPHALPMPHAAQLACQIKAPTVLHRHPPMDLLDTTADQIVSWQSHFSGGPDHRRRMAPGQRLATLGLLQRALKPQG